MTKTRILVVGTGNMGSAIARALDKRENTEVFVTNRTRAKAEKTAEGTSIRVLERIADMKGADAVILAVKPDKISVVADEVSALEASLYISTAAGVDLSSLEKYLKKKNVARYMPNIAASVGASVTAVTYADDLDEEKKQEAVELASSFGSAFYLEERLFNAFIGISGSGIAYVFCFLHALALGGVREGLGYKDALSIAGDTLLSAVALQKANGKGAIENEIMVCSPKGTTIEGVKKLKEFNFENSVIEAVSAAARKACGGGRD